MKYFVVKAGELYGSEFLVYNVHSLIHLVDDVAQYGSLDQFRSFPFENYLQKLTKFVRSGKSPLAQIVKRLSESQGHIFEIDDSNVISIKPPNNGYILENSVCCMVTAEVVDSQCKEKMFSCRVYDRSDPRFVDPCDSRIIEVHSVSNRNSRMKLLPASSLKKRALVFPLETSSFLFLTILHKC